MLLSDKLCHIQATKIVQHALDLVTDGAVGSTPFQHLIKRLSFHV